MRKDTRKVIETRMVEAINKLGGVAHTQDVKDKILELEGATYENFGRTKPNAKYPEGRFRFVESFAHIAKKMKNEGICFSPRRFYISTDPNAVAPEKETTKVTRKPRKKAKPVVEQEAVEQEVVEQEAVEQEVVEQEAVEQEVVEQEAVEQEAVEQEAVEQEAVEQEAVEQEAVEQTQSIPSMSQDEEGGSYMASFPPTTQLEEKELEEKDHHPPMAKDEDDIADEDLLTPFFPCSIYAYLDREEEKRIEVDEKGRAWEVNLTDEERAKFFPQNDLSPVEEAQEVIEEAQEVIEEAQEVIEEAQEVIEGASESDFYADGNKIDEEVYAVSETESQAEEYTISEEETPVESKEEVLSQALEIDGLFDEEEEENPPSEEEAQAIFLELVEGNVWGAIEDGNVYLSEAQSGEVVLSFSEDVSPLDFLPESRKEKQRLILADAKKKGLKGYTSKIFKVIEKTSERAQSGIEGWETHHVEGSRFGCFGAESVDRTQCSQVCALSAICIDSL